MLVGGAGDGAVRGYRSNTGELMWTSNLHSEATTGLVVSELWEQIVSASSNGSLIACQIRGGVKLWERAVFADQSGVTVMAAGEDIWTVFLGGECGVVVAVDVREGKELWRSEPAPFDVAALHVVMPVGVPSFLAKYVYSFLLCEDSQGVITARDTKVCLCNLPCPYDSLQWPRNPGR